MTVARRLSCLCSLLVCTLVSGCFYPEAFVDSRALQHRGGSVVVCRTSDAEEAGKVLAEQICRDNWLPAPALVGSTSFTCSVSAPVSDIYVCGGKPTKVVQTSVGASVTTGAISSSSVTDQVLSVDIGERDERPMLFSRGD